MPDSPAAPELRGRERETAALRRLLAQRDGGALVIAGADGIGKSALLEHARSTASGFRIAHVSGVRAEREIPFAALDRLLRSAGRRTAEPLLCCVDDIADLDPESLAALAFWARRAETGRVLLVFAADRATANGQLAGVEQLHVDALDDDACRRLLADRFGPALNPAVVSEIVLRAAGNPLALLEAADALSAEQCAGLAPVPSVLPRTSRFRNQLRSRFGELSERAKQLAALVLAADEDLAAEICGDIDEAIRAGLVVVDGDRVRVPSEFARACLRADAPAALLRDAHRRLALIADDEVAAAWHRLKAGDQATGDLPVRLQEIAESARRAGRHAAAAAAAAKSAELTAEPERKAQLLLAAGRDSLLAGGSLRARTLVCRARPMIGSSRSRGLAGLVSGELELRDGMPAAAHHDLRGAAARLIGTDRELAVTALVLAGEANCVTGDYERFFAVAKETEQLRSLHDGPATTLLLDHVRGMAALFQGRHATAVPALRNVLRLVDEGTGSLPRILASQAAFALGEPLRAHDLAQRAVVAARERGEIAQLPWAFVYLALSALLLDRYADAETSALEGLRMARATDQRNIAIDHLALLALVAALRGDRETAWGRLAGAFGSGVATRGLGRPGAFGTWAMGCAELASGRPADAVRRLRSTAPGSGRVNPVVRVLAVPHLVESAADCGEGARARRSLQAFDDWVGTTGSQARMALSHRCHALLAERESDADERFHAAIELHRSSGSAVELARTELLYAKRLRRRRKPRLARELLSEACAIFREFGVDSWAEQAGAELRAAGAGAPRTAPARGGELTPQQSEICRLVADGATNREIAQRLYISHRTVDHHLRNIFAKLGVRSRVELAKLVR
ncbi:LuxR C-terminal-related transcriptional regulator [Saccharopolyspora sp. NPDC050389]|uniref:helix-turn-helix transcriptional regulator n=1 Tax=Saccharopolyspora sp. NPDC050389 TaxID=3155516 RepID=UPI00340FFBF3